MLHHALNAQQQLGRTKPTLMQPTANVFKSVLWLTLLQILLIIYVMLVTLIVQAAAQHPTTAMDV